MSGATVSLNPKLADGTIVQIGGVGYDDFYQNLVGVVGAENAEHIVQGIKHRLIPASAGAQSAPPAPIAPQAPAQDPWGTEQQAQHLLAQTFPGAQPTQPQQQSSPPGQQAPNCPNHQQPAKWVPPGVSKRTGQPYSGFWSCAQGDKSCRFR